jgi:hypothetical protein
VEGLSREDAAELKRLRVLGVVNDGDGQPLRTRCCSDSQRRGESARLAALVEPRQRNERPKFSQMRPKRRPRPRTPAPRLRRDRRLTWSYWRWRRDLNPRRLSPHALSSSADGGSGVSGDIRPRVTEGHSARRGRGRTCPNETTDETNHAAGVPNRIRVIEWARPALAGRRDGRSTHCRLWSIAVVLAAAVSYPLSKSPLGTP